MHLLINLVLCKMSNLQMPGKAGIQAVRVKQPCKLAHRPISAASCARSRLSLTSSDSGKAEKMFRFDLDTASEIH
ncbi:MAG: hypothetical protein FJW26_21630 [Acidimicrobiia bacterium]|nr:hypothetical protein [Acidimicrobiia bacterium]